MLYSEYRTFYIVIIILIQKLHLHPLNDPTDFGSMSDLYGISKREGLDNEGKRRRERVKKWSDS